uniref:Chromosome 8 open reading frame 34 n=1 Tax=Propithecus coquereli TaxID=379532 RepID=A0A2K6F1U8_PROCO
MLFFIIFFCLKVFPNFSYDFFFASLVYTSVLFNFLVFVDVPVFLLFFISNFILFLLEKVLCMISIFKNILRLILMPNNVPCALEKNVYPTVVCKMFCIHLLGLIVPRSVEHPKWNWRTKPESRDFDELNHILQESKKLGKALENLSRSNTFFSSLQETVAFNSALLRPRVIGEWIGREENDADPLAAEMLQPPIPRSKNDQWENEDSGSSPAGSLKMEPKTKGLKQQQQQHKKLLAAMLSQDSFESVHSPTPSVTEEDIDNEDDAMELLEDLNDLRMEGVTTLVPSGSKFNQGRPTHPAEPQAKVTLNICSRCARLQGDNLAERTEETLQILHSPDETIPDSLEGSSEGHPLKTYMEEDESLKQLQVVHQPWILPSDTESEGVEAEQEKRSADLLLCVPCSSCPALVYSGMFAQGA